MDEIDGEFRREFFEWREIDEQIERKRELTGLIRGLGLGFDGWGERNIQLDEYDEQKSEKMKNLNFILQPDRHSHHKIVRW